MSLRDLASSGRSKKKKRVSYARTLTRIEVSAMKKRGYDAERELVSMLRDEGYDALRIPVSAPSNEPLPDVFAVKNKSILAFEVKSMGKFAYFKENQITKLFDFLMIHRIYPNRFAILAAKFKYRGWWFGIPDKPGNYSLKIGIGLRFEELIEVISDVK
jgi:Holliday junction resolvase